MDEHRTLLSQYWNWLPAFRAVAESEHLPTAAQRLNTSASALSRAVKHLEDALGLPLFDRSAGRMLLNEAGRGLLAHVREAMRRIDDGAQAASQSTFSGALKIVASHSVATTYVLPALLALLRAQPKLRPEVVQLPHDAIADALLRGVIDVALVERSDVPEQLELTWLESSSYSLYCGSTHPLAQRHEVSLEECLAFPFVAPPPEVGDGFPQHLRREVALRVSALELGARACASGALLAVLPDDYALGATQALRRLPIDPLGEQPIFIARRHALTRADRVSAFTAALQETVVALDREKPERFVSSAE